MYIFIQNQRESYIFKQYIIKIIEKMNEQKYIVFFTKFKNYKIIFEKKIGLKYPSIIITKQYLKDYQKKIENKHEMNTKIIIIILQIYKINCLYSTIEKKRKEKENVSNSCNKFVIFLFMYDTEY
ncbi:hypothetical protein RFI_37746 [Reticulomyxa filosa]|uniref:Uncharacterized protein n=1 Tax=Reticulomyxa filosa TaxID=46433 RepID=X6LCG3_RETFI|nr:hypothetical protein RFI_37746 [Reticulomyxa filosa]|eukprot:ETN99722.1 hypothetical protein RFI_37746 [Reticulomyxa filosa]